MHLYKRLIFAVVLLLAFASYTEAGYETYTVKKGDTLCELSMKEYELNRCITPAVEIIREASFVKNADVIYIGQILIIAEQGTAAENLPTRQEVVALNKEKWIARFLENPKLIGREAIKEPELKINNDPEPVIIPELNIQLAQHLPTLLPRLEQPQAPPLPIIRKPEPKPTTYAPHLNWSNILQGLEEYPEEKPSKSKKRRKN